MTFDDDKCRELLREFHEIVHEQQPYAFLYSVEIYVRRSKLQNVVFQKYRPADRSIPRSID